MEHTRGDSRQHGANPPPLEPRLTMRRTRRLGLVRFDLSHLESDAWQFAAAIGILD